MGPRSGFVLLLPLLLLISDLSYMMSSLLLQYLLRPGVSGGGGVCPLPENLQEEAEKERCENREH